MKKVVFVIVASVLLTSCTSIMQKKYCNYLPKTDKPPQWVNGSTKLAGYYVGIGSCCNPYLKPQKQIETAIANARSDLSKNVSIYISSRINARYFKKANYVSKEIEILNTQLTNILITNSEVSSKWLDNKSCMLWVRVIADQNEMNRNLDLRFKNIKRLNDLKADFTNIINQKENFHQRIAGLKILKNNLKEIDFYLIGINPESSYNSYLTKISSFELKLINSIKAKPQAYQLKNILNNYQDVSLYDLEEYLKIINQTDFDLLKKSEYSYLEKNDITQKVVSRKNTIYFNRFYKVIKKSKDINKSKKERFYQLEVCEDFLKNIDFQYSKKSRNYYENKIEEMRYQIVNPAANIRLGLNFNQVIRKIGKPDEVLTSYFLFSDVNGIRYGEHWLISDDGKVVHCVVKQQGFKKHCGMAGCEPRSCKWHKKNRRSFVIK